MRRSAAPSRLGAAKRPRFSPPLETEGRDTVPVTGTLAEAADVQNITAGSPDCDRRISSTGSQKLSHMVPSLPRPLRVQNGPPIADQLNKGVAAAVTHRLGAKFYCPLQQNSGLAALACPLPGSRTECEASLTSKYFSVVWCKFSRKKHKKWEGDAILFTQGKTAVLYDMEGKQISRSSGFQKSVLNNVEENQTLMLGGKEIQVMSVVSEESFMSGKCFSSSSHSSAVSHHTLKSTGMTQPFINPQKSDDATKVKPSLCAKEKPMNICRFDPTDPGALVMPRPHPSHQWKFNKNALPVIDVVVDPCIARHLRSHQKEGVLFLYECVMGLRDFCGQGAILADDMGLGKTLQCIALIWTLYKQGPYGGKPVLKKVLVVTPGSLVKNWFQEFKKWLGSERISVFTVDSENKVQEFIKRPSWPVMVVSYEMFVREFEDIETIHFDLMVCDEGHRLKNTAIKTTALLTSLPVTRRVVLTGTPVQNDLQEFFSLIEFCNPGTLGSVTAFRKVYEEPILSARDPRASQQEVALGDERAQELSRLTKLFILRRTQEINNQYLPPKADLVVFCRPAPLQLRLYRQILKSQFFTSCFTGHTDRALHLICISALKKLCNHPSLLYNTAKAASVASKDEEQEIMYKELLPLYPETYHPELELVESCGKLSVLAALLAGISSLPSLNKVVLVANYTKTLDLLQLFCTQRRYTYCRLDGQTPTKSRMQIVKHFNSKFSQDFIFLLSSKAGGVGLNLIGASRLILYDIDWNPANDLQAMARVWRDGQKEKVYIYRFLTTGSIEEKVYQRQISKQGLSGVVMDAKDRRNVHFSLDDLKDLFSLNENTQCETHDLLKCNCEHDDKKKPKAADTAAVRACQLGARVMKSKKNITMDELLDWNHIQPSAIANYPDWHLSSAVERISYIFWSEVKAKDGGGVR